MKKISRVQVFILGILVCAFLAGGCAGSKTYLFNIRYEPNPPVLVKSSAKPVTVALYMFQDTRPDRVYMGQRLYPDGKVDYYKPENRSIEQIVTRAIAQNLEQAGFRVKMINRYLDPKKEEFQEYTQGMRELLRNFLEFFLSYGLELGKQPQDKEFEELSRKLQSLADSGKR